MSADLRVVVAGETDAPKPLVKVRRDTAKFLRQLAKIVESGNGYTTQGQARDPICALMLVAFSADGEPTPWTSGIHGENWDDDDAFGALVSDAELALNTYRTVRGWTVRQFMERTGETEMTSSQQGVREEWLRRQEFRDRYRQERADKAEAAARERPFLCDCGFRAKSRGGLTNHLARSSKHRSAS